MAGGCVDFRTMLMQLLTCNKGGVEVGAVALKVGFPQVSVSPIGGRLLGGAVSIVNQNSHATTLRHYIFYYDTYIRPTFGQKRLSDVRRSDVRLFYNRLKEDRCLKVSTIDNVHNVLYQVFQVAVEDDIIRGNPAANMMKEFKLSHNIDTEKRRALTIAQQNLFLDFLRKKPRYVHWYPIFYIMTNTGMRVGEITGLRWRDIDLDKGVISVNHTLVYYDHGNGKGCSFGVNTPKTAAGCRTIRMVAGVKEDFIMEREYQKEAEIECKTRVEGYDDFIFVNKDGGVQHQGTLNKAIRRIIRDCNDEVLEKKGVENATVLLPHFSCHHLRHTFATRLCESGINIKVIQDMLGHADIETTMNIYVAVTEELKKQETDIFDAYMAAIEKQGETA